MTGNVGLLFIGNNGANACATKSAISNFIIHNDEFTRLGISTLNIINQELLLCPSSIVVSGWDVRGDLTDHLVSNGTATGVLLPTDTLLGDEQIDVADSKGFIDAVDILKAQITDFRKLYELEQIIVMNLSSPPRRIDLPEEIYDCKSFLSQGEIMPSAYAYAYAAVSSGCHYVDFTPSQVLECQFLVKEAERNGVQVAGRDGSTGQTFMKTLISSALLMRGFNITSWYSANILGNRDGEVLMIPGVDETKQNDKKYGLNLMSGMDPRNHHVDIQYLSHLGDIKEAYDSVTCEDFMGNQIEIKLIWRAYDSPIAAQLILDMTRLIAVANGVKTGLRRDLSFFFKHPIDERPRSPFSFLTRFLEENPELLIDDTDSNDLNW